LEGWYSVGVDKYVFEVDNVIPLSATKLIPESTVSTEGGGGGTVTVCARVVGVLLDSVMVVVFFNRDLNENFCFGSLFCFSVSNILDNSFNCYMINSNTNRQVPPDIVVDRSWAATMRVEYTLH
jgi:hypothetical protein